MNRSALGLCLFLAGCLILVILNLPPIVQFGITNHMEKLCVSLYLLAALTAGYGLFLTLKTRIQ